MMARSDLLRLPAGDRLAMYRAARKRADARLRAAHRDEYESLVEHELASPCSDDRCPCSSGSRP